MPLDLPHLAEEIAGLGKDGLDGLRSWTICIIERLLLLQRSPSLDPRRHWTREIIAFQRDVGAHLTTTLRTDLRRRLPRLYTEARRGLVTELSPYGEAHIAARLPEECPYTLDQVPGDWWPKEPHVVKDGQFSC